MVAGMSDDAKTHAVRLDAEDRARLAEIQRFTGIRNISDVLRAGLRAYQRELRLDQVKPRATGTEG